MNEHQAAVKACAFGRVHLAVFPLDVVALVRDGPRVKSRAVYLAEDQLLSFEPLGEIMRDLFDCGSFSKGTFAHLKADGARRLEPVDAAIGKRVAAGPVTRFDAIRVWTTGSLDWLHAVSTVNF